VAPGPGHSSQFSGGRLLVPIWMSPQYQHRPSAVAAIYSDDHGATWHPGALLPQTLVNPGESVALELADGRVMLNIRKEEPDHRRAMAFSPDGISNWTIPALQPDLFESSCMAGMLRIGRNRIAFANPQPSRAMTSPSE